VLKPRRWPEFYSVGMLNGSEAYNEINEQLLNEFKVVPVYSAYVDLRRLDSSI